MDVAATHKLKISNFDYVKEVNNITEISISNTPVHN